MVTELPFVDVVTPVPGMMFVIDELYMLVRRFRMTTPLLAHVAIFDERLTRLVNVVVSVEPDAVEFIVTELPFVDE